MKKSASGLYFVKNFMIVSYAFCALIDIVGWARARIAIFASAKEVMFSLPLVS